MFAKLFDTDQGQILVKKDASEGREGGPEVRFFFQPEGLGVCSTALGFPDNDTGWDAADAVFEDIDEAKAIDIVSNAMAPFSSIHSLDEPA